jgi:hypothetical protein
MYSQIIGKSGRHLFAISCHHCPTVVLSADQELSQIDLQASKMVVCMVGGNSALRVLGGWRTHCSQSMS